MIKISHLTKVYRSKRKKKSTALADISLTLPNAGMVFILGKSGSGKSTLLNVLGGLDKATSGEIDVGGNIISRFNEAYLVNYRNSHVGFIFQDYHLIDELTVYENIRLALSLLHKDQHEAILDALDKVGLAGYENRFPSELSGGERQRVAIARAVVKQPRIILADEPTGNLDNQTAQQIITILKSLSKDCLIITVSHNTSDAYHYADRIIELSKGRIASDFTRNPDFSDRMRLENGTLLYPQYTYLDDRDMDLINEELSAGAVRRIIKSTDRFIPTRSIEDSTVKESIRYARLRTDEFWHLAFRFLQNKLLDIVLSSFMVAMIMVIMALAQTIILFDANDIIAEEMLKSEMKTLFLIKQTDEETQRQLDEEYRFEIDPTDIQAFYDAGYEGTIYPIWNISLPVTHSRHAAGFDQSYFSVKHYINETLGTMIVDEVFLQKRFGEIEYLAKLDQFDPLGVIITDYVADSIIATNSAYVHKTYSDLLGGYNQAGFEKSMIINAIINTGYQERYAGVLKKIDDGDFARSSEMFQDEEFIKLTNEIYEKLGFCYSLNENFGTEYPTSYLSAPMVYPQKIIVNERIPLGPDYIGRYYFLYGTDAKKTIGGWYVTQASLRVPENAAYIRVTFGTTKKITEDPSFTMLPVAEKMTAHVLFSNGQIVDTQSINYAANTWLDGLTGELVPQTAYPNTYVSDFIPIPEGCTIEEFCTIAAYNNAYCAFYDKNKAFISAYSHRLREALPDGTVVMNYYQYNDLFGTDYNNNNLDRFVPHTVTLTQYRLYDKTCENPLFSTEVTISALTPNAWQVADDVSRLFEQTQFYVSALYFDGTDGIAAIPKAAQLLNYEHQSILVEGISTMTRAVEVFVPIFQLVAVILCIGVVFILVSFSSRLIRQKMHEIGIMKALGGKNSTVGAIFGVQVVAIAILTCLLSSVGYYLFIDLANDVLMASLSRLAPSRIVLDVNFLTFQPAIAAINCVFVGLLSAMALLVPMMKVRRIEPVKIIRARS